MVLRWIARIADAIGKRITLFRIKQSLPCIAIVKNIEQNKSFTDKVTVKYEKIRLNKQINAIKNRLV
jgi:hypothetical protein